MITTIINLKPFSRLNINYNLLNPFTFNPHELVSTPSPCPLFTTHHCANWIGHSTCNFFVNIYHFQACSAACMFKVFQVLSALPIWYKQQIMRSIYYGIVVIVSMIIAFKFHYIAKFDCVLTNTY